MRIDVITLFEPMFAAITENGITSRAIDRGLWSLHTWNPREETEDNHRTVDDRPFGGGPGMVMMAEPLARTVRRIRRAGNKGRVVSFAPNGTRLTDETVRRWVAEGGDMVLICGRYEGIDQRFLDTFVDETVSVGDFVLSCVSCRAPSRSFLRSMNRFPRDFWMRRITRARKSGKAKGCPRFCSRATTPISPAGRASRRLRLRLQRGPI